MNDSLTDAYIAIHDASPCLDLSWDEFIDLVDALGCIFNSDEDTIAEWLIHSVELPYSINCQKVIKPHGSIVFIP